MKIILSSTILEILWYQNERACKYNNKFSILLYKELGYKIFSVCSNHLNSNRKSSLTVK